MSESFDMSHNTGCSYLYTFALPAILATF